MRYVAYTSKLYSGVMLLAVAGFGGVIFMVWDQMPMVARVAMGVLICLGVAASIAGLFSTKPVIVADEEGLLCYRLTIKKIAWKDVVAVEHLPRRRKLSNGKTMVSPSESKRPIEVYISNIDKYTGGIVAWGLKRHLDINANYPDCARLVIECTGTTAKSPDLYECILSHIKDASVETK